MYGHIKYNRRRGRIRLKKHGDYETGPWAIIDLNGVILSNKVLHKDEDSFGQPVADIAALITMVKDYGYKVMLFATRQISEGTAKWMEGQGLNFDVVLSLPTKQYPNAGTLYLNDRVIGFDEDDIVGSLAYIRKRLEQEQQRIHRVYGTTVNELVGRRIRKHKKDRLMNQLRGEIDPLVISAHAVVDGSGSKNSVIFGDF